MADFGYDISDYTDVDPVFGTSPAAVEAAMHDVLRFWLDRGADGFRIDVIYKLAKEPELRDNEPCLRHDQHGPHPSRRYIRGPAIRAPVTKTVPS